LARSRRRRSGSGKSLSPASAEWCERSRQSDRTIAKFPNKAIDYDAHGLSGIEVAVSQHVVAVEISLKEKKSELNQQCNLRCSTFVCR
jgi:hypothetical protein